MKERVFEFVSGIQSEKRIASYDEASTKQAVILRILSILGWDTYNVNEVNPEYVVHGKRVDYSLRCNSHNEVFIEVKKIGEELEKHQEQLLNYSFRQGVKLAILTNGITWWFYLPLQEGSWEQRKYYTIELYDQNAEDITGNFIDFLSKDNVASGRAKQNAENVYRSKQKSHIIKDTLPKAWEKLICNPDDAFLDLLADTTERICGLRPDVDTVNDFLNTLLFSQEKKVNVCAQKTPKIKTNKSIGNSNSTYSNKKIVSYSFLGTRHEPKAWKHMLFQISESLASRHRDKFDAVLGLTGRKRPYYTKNPDELRAPVPVAGTKIYVESNLSANHIVKITRDVIALFGYKKEDLHIETE